MSKIRYQSNFAFSMGIVLLKFAEGIKFAFSGRNDGRGMQSLFVNGSVYFLPPPLTKFAGPLLCTSRTLKAESLRGFFPEGSENAAVDLTSKVALESSPFYRLIASLVQFDFFYPVDN